mgnify:CR=1 FL=1
MAATLGSVTSIMTFSESTIQSSVRQTSQPNSFCGRESAGRPRMAATLAMPTSRPLRRWRIGLTKGWKVAARPTVLVA